MDKILNTFNENNKCEVYENMYQCLFRDISNVLVVLKNKDIKSIDSAISLLKNAQCKTEEIFVDTEQLDSDNSLYMNIFKRTDLQNIGYFLKERSLSKEKDNSSFTQRECKAEKELEIQFSLGMKIGAKPLFNYSL